MSPYHTVPYRSLRGQRFRRSSLKKEHDWIGDPDWEPHGEIWIHTSELDSAERGRSGVLRSGERRSSWTILETYLHGSGKAKRELESKMTVLRRRIL